VAGLTASPCLPLPHPCSGMQRRAPHALCSKAIPAGLWQSHLAMSRQVEATGNTTGLPTNLDMCIYTFRLLAVFHCGT
jgi:hypothetical protein